MMAETDTKQNFTIKSFAYCRLIYFYKNNDTKRDQYKKYYYKNIGRNEREIKSNVIRKDLCTGYRLAKTVPVQGNLEDVWCYDSSML